MRATFHPHREAESDRDAGWLEEVDFEAEEADREELRTPAEQARIEHAHLEDTADHPTTEGEGAATEEGMPPEPPEAAIFDRQEDEEDDLELELELPEDSAAERLWFEQGEPKDFDFDD